MSTHANGAFDGFIDFCSLGRAVNSCLTYSDDTVNL